MDVTTLLVTGDLILDLPNPDGYFEFCGEVLRSGDFVIGHVEVPHTSRGWENSTDIPAPPANPAHLEAMKNAGFNIATLAGNHIHDLGREGIEDTVSTLSSLGIATTGIGLNIVEARRPAIIQRKGMKVGVLSYNAVGPREGWATSKKSGCAYVRVLTHYELEQATPGAPPAIYTFVDNTSMELMTNDIKELCQRSDIAVVSFHKGVVHTPAHIEMYERPLCYAAIDAGADIVVGQHAHILQGIEVYRNKPIFHNLGNFVTVTYALTPSDDNGSPERRAWAMKREKMFGFKPDPDMPYYPFHPDSRKTMIAKCQITRDGIVEAGYIPCFIDKQARPHILRNKKDAASVTEYVSQITKESGLQTQYEWAEGWVVAR